VHAPHAETIVRIREIDGLRAIAALAVIAVHYFSWIKYSGAMYGWLGVDLFFVISGFLITSILIKLKSAPDYFTTFYARRAFRIFPPYFFVTTIYLLYSLAVHKPGTMGLWTRYIFYYASLLFVKESDYDALAPPVRFGLVVLWSLSVEELFYIFWAPAVRWIRAGYFSILLAGIIVAAPIFRWALHQHSPADVFTFYCRMDGLAFGSLIALIVRARQRTPQRYPVTDRTLDRVCLALGILFVIFFAIAGGDFTSRRVFVLGVTLADLFFASALLVVVRHSGSTALRFLRFAPLVSIGTISYSLYLVHYPLLIVSQNICSHFLLKRWVNAADSRPIAYGSKTSSFRRPLPLQATEPSLLRSDPMS
jgi:peptidoglycan/LPS O-acetylase OafA/YrhL